MVLTFGHMVLTSNTICLGGDLEFVAEIAYETMFVWAVWASVRSLGED